MMSLLNDMLRDLSHQQKPVEAAIAIQDPAQDVHAQEQRELFHHTRAVKPLPRTFIPSLIIFVLVLVVISVWKMDLFSDPKISVKPVVPGNSEAGNIGNGYAGTVSPNNTGAIAQSAILPPLSTVTSASITPSVSQAVEEKTLTPELGARIAALESAINNLSAVVANTNSGSRDEEVLADPDFGQGTGYETAFVESDIQDDAQLLQADSFTTQAIEDVPESVSIREPFEQPLLGQSVSEQSQANQFPVEQSQSDQGEAQFSIEPNVKWQDQQQAQQASQLAAQGQINSAIEKLQNYIATAAKPEQSTKTLLDIFAAQENVSAMQALLAQADYLSVIEKTFYGAKIAVIQQKESQAIQLLEAHLDQAENDENYRALLAGLYQRTGMNMEAANHYRRLLSVFGDKPAYWLGFALAQDALDQPQVAAQAYQRVNQYTELQPQVRSYVQQRISALQQ